MIHDYRLHYVIAGPSQIHLCHTEIVLPVNDVLWHWVDAKSVHARSVASAMVEEFTTT